MEILTYLWETFAFDLFFLAACLLVGRFQRKRDRFWLRLLCAVAALCLFSFLWDFLLDAFPALDFFLSCMYYTLCFCIAAGGMLLCFESTLFGTLFAVSVAYCMQHFVERCTSAIDLLVGISHLSYAQMLLRTGLTVAVYLLVDLFYLRKNRDDLRKIQVDSKAQLLCSVVIILLTVIIDLGAIIEYYSLYTDDDCSFMVFYYCMSALSVAVVFLHESNLLSQRKLTEDVRTLQEQLTEERQSYEKEKEAMELVNLKCHDIRHQLRDMQESGASGESIRELTECINVYDSFIKTGNDAIDVIMARNSLYCLQHGIKFSCMLDGEKLSFIPDHELYALFGNAVENAVQAAEKLDEEKRTISVSGRVSGGFISIDVSNFYEGELEFSPDGLPKTTKPDMQNHGFGMKSMRLLTEKYGGRLRVTAENGLFVLNIFFPLPQHAETENAGA